MKKTSTLILRNSLLLLTSFVMFFSLRATAQTTPQTKLAAPRITQAIDEASLVKTGGKVHPLARAEFDRGVVADSQPMNRILLVLKRSTEQQAALSELMDEQQTKNSPNYHAWLTPAQFGLQFGVADADVQRVTNWLAQKGFTGIKTTPGNMFIEFSGTVGAVRNAFHTEIHQFMVKGEMHMANVSAPQIPAALAPVVSGVHSLHNFRKKSFMHLAKPQAIAEAKKGAGPNFTFAQACGSNGTQPCAAVAPGDFAKIYNLPANLDGTGQTIALVARSNVTVSDINQFGTAFGISNLTNFSVANNVVLTGPDPGIVLGDDGEATLDIEWSGAVAPKAKILLVVSDIQASTFIDGVDLSAIYIVTNNLAQIVSESFGACEFVANDGLENALWEQAASQGMTVMVSTGDTGSAGCDPDLFPNASDAGLQISGTASTPFNVAVGGTDFDDAANPSTYWNTTNSGTGLGSAKSYIPEITWNGSVCASAATSGTLNSTCASVDPADPNSPDLSAGAGGQSNCGIVVAGNCAGYPKPAWQKLANLTGMPADNVRDIPDVSLFAAVNTPSKHFYVICLADSLLQNGQPCSLTGANLNFSGVGGTSASSPAFAGIMALVNQNEVNNNRLKAGEGQGNANFVLYKLAVSQYGTAGLNCNSSTGPNASCTFNDVTKGNNSVPCVGSWSPATFGASVLGLAATPNCSTAAANAIGVLVEPSSPAPFSTTTPGFTTTAGYDLATGLGSVNVSNLVTNWSTVTTNFKTSTSTITSTVPATLTALNHGQNVTFNISVTSGSGTPTGDVTLVPSAALSTNGTIFATLTNGTASIVTNQLPGGTYPVVVHYGGDGTFAASDSAPVTVTVSKENSSAATAMWEYWNFPNSTQLAPASAPYGSQYLFRVDVIGSQNQDNQTCAAATVTIPCPTGKVTFTADGNPMNDFLNTATGVSTNSALLNPLGFVEDRVLGSTGLKGGVHSIVASYAGDSSYNASAAPSLSITITPASTQTLVTVNGQATATVQTGQQISLVATVQTTTPLAGGLLGGSAGAGPTGSVTFSACGTAGSCTVTVVPTAASNTTGAASASATLSTTFATAGTQNITATFTSGDGNYFSCTTAVNTATQICNLTALNLTVTAAPAKVAFTVQPSNVVVNATITPAVQVTVEDVNGNVVPSATNPVTIAIGNNAGPGGVLGGTLTVPAVNGVATFPGLNINKTGNAYTLTAAATGLTGATSSAFNVTSAPGSFAISYSPNPLVLSSATGAAAPLTVTVTPTGGFTGPVVVTATAATLPPGVTCPNSPLTINITAANPVAMPLNCQVTAFSTTLTASNLREERMYDAKVMPPTQTIPPATGGKGWWALSAGTGFAALFLMFLPGGRKKYRAALGLGLVCLLGITLGCNGVYNGGTKPVATTTQMTVTNASAKVNSGTAFTFSVTVTGGTPGGMAQLFDGGVAISTAGASATVSGGKATLTGPTTLSVGTHSISVHYLGDTTTLASQSGSLNLTVAGSSTIAVTTTPAATPVAAAINITVQ
jgi:hypothetical protein